MSPWSNQHSWLFATARRHKFESISDATLQRLALHPIIDQTGTCIYKDSKVLAENLDPLAKIDYTIRDIFSFPDLLKSAQSGNNFKNVSHEGENLYPFKRLFDYILYKIYFKKELKPFCQKSIFRNLLNKLAKQCILPQITC